MCVCVQACKNNACVDLSPTHISDQSLYGRLSGQHYVTWDVKAWLQIVPTTLCYSLSVCVCVCVCVQAMLNSLGGVELLFPILEQVDLPLTARLGGEVGGRDEPPTEEQTHKAANCWLFTGVCVCVCIIIMCLQGGPPCSNWIITAKEIGGVFKAPTELYCHEWL